MNAAQEIIQRFGGQSALAQLLGKGQSTVSYWAKTGIIPAKWRPKLLQLASEKSVNLLPAEFDLSVHVISDYAEPTLQKATHWGELKIGYIPIPCYVLENGERIFSLKGVVVALMGVKGGQLAEYIKVQSIKPFLPQDLLPAENNHIPALKCV